jgi:hypothetical protein
VASMGKVLVPDKLLYGAAIQYACVKLA